MDNPQGNTVSEVGASTPCDHLWATRDIEVNSGRPFCQQCGLDWQLALAPPWEVVPGVYDSNPETASEFPHGPEIVCGNETIAYMQMYGEDKAELIVRAVNAYAYMLAALRLFDEFAWTAVKADCQEASDELNRRIQCARAAITKATATTDTHRDHAAENAGGREDS